MIILDQTYRPESTTPKVGNGPMWGEREWDDLLERGEVTWAEYEMHQNEMGRKVNINSMNTETRQLQEKVRSRVKKKINKIKGVDISQVPSLLRGLTIYRLRLPENSSCVRIVIRPDQDWERDGKIRDGKIVVELVNEKGQVIDDIFED